MKQGKPNQKQPSHPELDKLREAQLRQSLAVMNDLLNSGARQHIVQAVQQSLDARKRQ
jgi:hypothetical protein